MRKRSRFSPFTNFLWWLMPAALLFAAGCHRNPATAPPPAPPPASTSQNPAPKTNPAAAAPAKTGSPAAPAKVDKALTSAKEADQLFQQMHAVLEFVSGDTRLPIRHAVKHKLVSRDEVEKRTKTRMEKDKDTKRLEHAAVVLKKFGLIPRDFDLRDYLVSLLKEQVAGFYNSQDQTMYLLNWIPAQEQLNIMAHELTHALQDQDVNMKSWLRGGQPASADDDDEAKLTNAAAADRRVEEDEDTTAREALVEGQGMVVMIDYVLRNTGHNTLDAPFVVESVKQGMRGGGDFPIFKRAPAYLQESLAFPYSYGLDFVEALLLKGGPGLAYEGALRRPPENTREIMEPNAYLKHEQETRFEFPELLPVLGKGYESYDAGSMGEFDVLTFLQQFSGGKVAEKLARGWRGGGYWAFRIRSQKSQSGAAADATGSVALLYLSRWAAPEQAQQFAAEYVRTLSERYQYAHPQPPAAANAPVDEWLTDEGPVLVESRGNLTLALESFDQPTLEKIRGTVWSFEKPEGDAASRAAN